MTMFNRLAAVAVALSLPAAAVAQNDQYLPEQRFLDTFTIQSWLDADLPGGSYTNELARAYQERADFEAAYGRLTDGGDTNWYDATAFANKSIRAAAGEVVEPWHPSVLGVDDPLVLLAYEATVRRAATYRAVAPVACAQLVALYDHFLEEFDEADGPYPPHPVTDPRVVLDDWVAAYQACYEPASIYGFPVDHCENTDGYIPDEPAGIDNQRSVAEALAAQLGADEASGLLELVEAMILVEGHASTTASRRYNRQLSECRAGFMRELLVVAGVDPARIDILAAGETVLEVQTGDGVEEYRNRRVVVDEHN